MPTTPCDVLITGAAGFIGSHLTDRLLAEGRTVIGIDNFSDYYDPDRKRHNLEAVLANKNFTLVEADIRDGETIDKAFDQHPPRAVAHLAACANVRYSIGRAKLYTDVNVLGSVNMLEAACRHEVDVFVFASTSSVYGHATQIPFVETDPCAQPLAPYPASKRAVELIGYTYHNLHQLNFTAVRPFNVYGPRSRPDTMPIIVTDRILKGQTIDLFDGGHMKRDWTYIDDIVSGIAEALKRPLDYEIINLGRGEPVVVAQFVRIIEELTGKKAKLNTPPAPASDPDITAADIQKARKLLQYNPQTSLKNGLAHFWQWYQQ